MLYLGDTISAEKAERIGMINKVVPDAELAAATKRYARRLALIGREALAVTTNCSIDFMRKPAAGADLIATGQLLKLGRVLAIGDVHLRSEGSPDLVARATLTYSIPPAR